MMGKTITGLSWLLVATLLSLPSNAFSPFAIRKIVPVASAGTPSSQENVKRHVSHSEIAKLHMAAGEDDDNKFGMEQRIDSGKSLVLGAIAGSIALAPFGALHHLGLPNTDVFNFLVDTSGLVQYEFDTDAGAVQAGLFAIVYRYCIREDTNPQLNQGVIGAFAIVRTLSKIVVPSYCSAIPLNCGAPLGYLDWALIQQLAINGIESAAMFAVTALALDFAMNKGFISKFPG